MTISGLGVWKQLVCATARPNLNSTVSPRGGSDRSARAHEVQLCDKGGQPGRGRLQSGAALEGQARLAGGWGKGQSVLRNRDPSAMALSWPTRAQRCMLPLGTSLVQLFADSGMQILRTCTRLA